MKLQREYFSVEKDGFFGAYFPNSNGTNRCMIALLGDDIDDRMAVSGVKWLHSRNCNVRNLADSHMYSAKRKMKQELFRGAGKNDPIYNEEMFRKLIGQMPVIVFFKDTACRYQYISNYNEKHLKNKSETQYGIGLTDLELQGDAARGREYYEDDLRILSTGVGSILNSVIVEDGKPHYYQITKSAVRDEEYNIIGIAGVVMDVTATRVKSADLL